MQINQSYFQLNSLYSSNPAVSKAGNKLLFTGEQDTVTINSKNSDPVADLKKKNKNLEKKIKELELENSKLRKENMQLKENQKQQEKRLKSLEGIRKKISM